LSEPIPSAKLFVYHMTWDIKWTQCWRGPNKLSTRWADLCCCWANCIQKKSLIWMEIQLS